ncbi:MAG TPA: autotransporter-associated beta strand repeat-containing protein [Verrucomicrobiae bacterium]
MNHKTTPHGTSTDFQRKLSVFGGLNSSIPLLVACLIGLSFIWPDFARADNHTWRGTIDGNWSTPGNWSSGVAPSAGDVLVFPRLTVAPLRYQVTNNYAVGTSFRSVVLQGPGYQLRGNAVLLTSSLLSTNAGKTGTNTVRIDLGLASISVGITNVAGTLEIYGNVGFTLSAATRQALDIVSEDTTRVYGQLSGSSYKQVLKYGPDALELRGTLANTLAGRLTVHEGSVLLCKPTGVAAVAGPLTIGRSGGSAATVRLLLDGQIGDNVSVSINDSGSLDLHGFNDAIGPLTMQGGVINNTSTGTLTLNGDVTASTAVAVVYGNVNLGASPRTFTVADPNPSGADFAIVGNVSGGPAAPGTALRKLGSGEMWLEGDNTFGGEIVVDEGQLTAAYSPSALGSTVGGTTVNNSAFLALVATSVGSEHLTLNSTNPSGALVSWVSPCAFAGDIYLSIPAVIAAHPDLTLGGVISGPGGFTKIGAGTLVLAGSTANTYLGNTFVNEGVLELAKSQAIVHGTLTIGDGLGGQYADIVRETQDDAIASDAGGVSVAIRSSGLLDLNNHRDKVGPLEVDSATIRTGATGVLWPYESVNMSAGSIEGNLVLNSACTFNVTNILLMFAQISGEGTLTKTGAGEMKFFGGKTYSGLTVVQGGRLVIEHPLGLGTTAQGTVVSNGASLVISVFSITNEALVLDGGVLSVEPFHDTFWVGPVTLTQESVVEVRYSSDETLHIIGPITGSGGVTKTGLGTLCFEGGSANTYSGTTRVNFGTLVLNKSISNGTIPGDLIVGDSSGPANDAVVRLVRANQIADTSNVTINDDGLLELAVGPDSINELRGTGHVNLNDFLVLGWSNGSSTFGGIVSGPGGIEKRGTGTITLTGANTYTNATLASVGTLVINGYQPQSPVTVGRDGTLSGYGTVGALVANGNVSPGWVLGTLRCDNLNFSSTGNFFVELRPGIAYDQLNVAGTIDLGSTVLHVMCLSGQEMRIGDQFFIINNDGAEAITGTFLDLPNGASFSASGFRFRINYNGGTGNDVVLTVVGLPAAQIGSAVTTGNGNHAIDPNECNLLSLVISNQTATPMTGLTATLSTANAGVMITQPYSEYPDAPASGNRTNLTPFQIATLPSFACGADVNLELIVNSTSHGSFVVPVVLPSGEPEASPLRYDAGTTVNIPDIGTVESTTLVAGFPGPLKKVAVSLWLTHPVDADLSLSLISPDGVVVDLSSGNGSGADFGSACSPEESRTTFDDLGPVAITGGSPPFMGTFRPEGYLAACVGGTANGNWRLRVTDNNGGTLGALRCWSLFLYPTACAPGSGFCDTCLAGIHGEITATDPVQTGQTGSDNVQASCASPKQWAGSHGGLYHYDLFTFTNASAADACVTVHLQSASDVMAVAYRGTNDPTMVGLRYLGDAGNSTLSSFGHTAFSCSVPAGWNLDVVVHEVQPDSGTLPYTLYVSGLPCPPPTLVIEPAGVPAKARLHWPTWAGEYTLDAASSLAASAWEPDPSEPIAGLGRYNVTNDVTGTNRFYRLHRQQ